MTIRLVHLAAGEPSARLWNPSFLGCLGSLGILELHRDTASWTDDRALECCREADVVLTGWGSRMLPAALATTPGRVRYVCHVTGEMREHVPIEIIRSGLPVTNWGDAPAHMVAESTLALLLACLKNLRPQIATKETGGWVEAGWIETLGSLRGLRVGLYGFGAIARRFDGLARSLGAHVSVFDPYARKVPAEIRQVADLAELFATSDAVSVHAPLTDQTRGSIRAEHLSRLRDHGIVINTARGAIFDEPALFAEIASGRIRAGLDVLTTDDAPLPATHPARQWPNLILTAHLAGMVKWPGGGDVLEPWHEVALDNLRRFIDGRPLRFPMDEARYLLST